MTLHKNLKALEKFIHDNSPTILTTVGVMGTVTTAVLTGRASYKAAQKLDEASDIWNEPIPPKDVFLLVWDLYIPPAVVGTATIASIILANRVSNRRAAALAAAYAISEKAMNDYRHKVIEKIGEKKEANIREEIAQEQVARADGSLVILNDGEVLCYDQFSDRYFKSSVEAIKSAENKINHRILNDNYASLTDWYNLVGLGRTSFSDEVGWNVDKLLEVAFSSVLTSEDKPCLSVEFRVVPVRDYYKLH